MLDSGLAREVRLGKGVYAWQSAAVRLIERLPSKTQQKLTEGRPSSFKALRLLPAYQTDLLPKPKPHSPLRLLVPVIVLLAATSRDLRAAKPCCTRSRRFCSVSLYSAKLPSAKCTANALLIPAFFTTFRMISKESSICSSCRRGGEVEVRGGVEG